MGLIKTVHAYDLELNNKIKERASKIRIGSNNAALGGNFVPNINMSKWDDEYFLNINLPIAITNEKEVFDGEKIKLDTKDYSLNFYPLNSDDLEFEITFNKKPDSNIIILDLLFSNGLEFFYQPPLTQAQIESGYVREERVVGSYAVYCDKKYNKYCAGKFCHIYYPYLKDADGKTARVEKFEILTGKMTITLPEAWMQTAKYPVILDPTLGNSVAGASSYGNTIVVNGTTYTSPASEGTATTFHIAVAAVDAANKGIKVGCYNCSQVNGDPPTKSRVDYTTIATATVSDDNSSAAVVGGTISASTKYHLCFIVQDTDTKVKCDDTGGDGYDNWPTTYAGELQDPYPNSGETNTEYFTIWLEYGAAAEVGIEVQTIG
jgi:hypothetical protein